MAYKQKSPKPVIEGGIGATSESAYSVICGGNTPTGALQTVSGTGSPGQILISSGSSALPIWQSFGGASDLVLINTQTLSGSIYNVQWGSSYVTGAYTSYIIVLNNWIFSGTVSEEITIDFTADNWSTRIPTGASGTNWIAYNSSSYANEYDASSRYNFINKLQGRDQGIGIIYVNLIDNGLSSPFAQTEAMWLGQFSTYNTAIGGQSSQFGGMVRSPTSSGYINGIAVRIVTAGNWTNITASLYGFQQ